MLMTAEGYRDSLRKYSPRVFVNGQRVESVVDEPLLQPGVNAIGLTYDYALRPKHAAVMTAPEPVAGRDVNRFVALMRSSDDLLTKLEAVRLMCRETGCAQRYLTGDALNALWQSTHRTDAQHGTTYHARLRAYLERVYAEDLTLGVAMTDAKGDRSRRPHRQTNPDAYLHVVEQQAGGIVISGTKAIVTGAPYVHEFLVLPGRRMTEDDAPFAVACAVPVDADGVTIVSRPAGRPGDPAASFSGKYGQSVAAVIFDRVFVPWERVFLCGEWQEAGFLTTTYATHHRHTCVAARAGFGDLLIGAGVLMCESNGLDPGATPHLRDSLVELIKIVEGFYACGVASSVFGLSDASGVFQPEPVYANVGKLLLATQIYDMHRIAHDVSGGLVVALPGPDEDHNPETEASLAAVFEAAPGVPVEHRRQVARLIEDLTASETGGWYSLISLHGGGSPEAMKHEIYRRYPLEEKAEIVERLLERGVHAGQRRLQANRQPGRCCVQGCQVPGPEHAHENHGGAESTEDPAKFF
jgi:4-hydroxybutyryl-CoA dehydratase/vinylacetyl-CoA-Delta-isomerase